MGFRVSVVSRISEVIRLACCRGLVGFRVSVLSRISEVIRLACCRGLVGFRVSVLSRISGDRVQCIGERNEIG